ncbi:MAG: isoleucine--tRNA ligase [Rhodospirillales bacterium]
MTADYKSTIFLPQTDFPMRAGLPVREPEILAEWERIGLYERLREQSKGRKPFILHDGPPYANGHLHIGHALNKILKDLINRCYQQLGHNANYVPGWDCHGLPIEWKIEEKYRADGRDKDDVPVVEFRKECRDFAEHWIGVQREEFKRMGVIGDWKAPYTTMTYRAEAQIVRELGKFLMDGSLYQGAKPVMWSPVEKTALAEAEVEYHDRQSLTVYVRFPVVKTSAPEIEGADLVIWTTTAWTMPGNRALAAGPEIDYAVIRVDAADESARVKPGARLVIAAERLASFAEAAGITKHTVENTLSGAQLDGTLCAHPWRGQGYDFDVPVLQADYASTDEGTGLVHIAPGHGAEDWVLATSKGVEVPQTVGEDGCFYAHVPMFAGKHVYKAGKEIAAALEAAGALAASGEITHRYPHSWRSKAPLIFRNTSQWFISMETTGLRAAALKAIDATRFVPESGRARLRGMIETRPDWCVSRQRAWGVPITVFVDKKTGEPLRDAAVHGRIAEAVEAEGADAWFASPPERFLGADHDAADYEQVRDILDVWFDSGSTHAFVLEDRKDLSSPATMYLEGTDQHRGWFHSSLLESCGTRGRAPYDIVLTHGFTNDEHGRKMSKSSGNQTAPQEVIEKYGADILRLWVAATDYSEDQRVGPEILKAQADSYRRVRNTLRYLLGNLDGFDESERLDVSEMPELERWVLHRLTEMDAAMRQNIADFDFHDLSADLHGFCAADLSAFYFDIRKDSLYCDAVDSKKRRAARTVLDILFDTLCVWWAPFLCFTAEEAWKCRRPDADSVHEQLFPEINPAWRDDELAAKWARLRDIRRVVTGALELERAEKRIGSSLQTAPVVHTDSGTAALLNALGEETLADVFITSGVTVSDTPAPKNAFTLEDIPGVSAAPAAAEGAKCARCWRVTPDIGGTAAHRELCGRCTTAAAGAVGP